MRTSRRAISASVDALEGLAELEPPSTLQARFGDHRHRSPWLTWRDRLVQLTGAITTSFGTRPTPGSRQPAQQCTSWNQFRGSAIPCPKTSGCSRTAGARARRCRVGSRRPGGVSCQHVVASHSGSGGTRSAGTTGVGINGPHAGRLRGGRARDVQAMACRRMLSRRVGVSVGVKTLACRGPPKNEGRSRIYGEWRREEAARKLDALLSSPSEARADVGSSSVLACVTLSANGSASVISGSASFGSCHSGSKHSPHIASSSSLVF